MTTILTTTWMNIFAEQRTQENIKPGFERPERHPETGMNNVERAARCTLTNLQEGSVFDLLASRTQTVVTAYLRALPRQSKWPLYRWIGGNRTKPSARYVSLKRASSWTSFM